MKIRESLSNRRPNRTVDLNFNGSRYSVGIGFYPDGRPAEVFVKGAKSGSSLDGLLDDAAILASLLLQHNVKPAAISKSMSRVRAGEPASIIAALADLLASEVGAG